MELFKIFLACAKPGILGFGGGPSMLPLVEKEVVENYRWLSTEEFTDAIALGNSLPGPITVKIAALTGYKVGRLPGAIMGIAGMTLPTAFIILILTKFYLMFKDLPRVASMLTAVRPVVVVLLLQITWQTAQKSFSNNKAGMIAAIALVAIFSFNIHPALIIVIAVLFGFFINK